MSVPVLFNAFELTIFCILGGLSAAGIVLGFSLIAYLVDTDKLGRSIAINNTFIVLGGCFAQVVFGAVKNISIIRLQFLDGIDIHYYDGLLFLLVFTLLSLLSISYIIFKMPRKEPLQVSSN